MTWRVLVTVSCRIQVGRSGFDDHRPHFLLQNPVGPTWPPDIQSNTRLHRQTIKIKPVTRAPSRINDPSRSRSMLQPEWPPAFRHPVEAQSRCLVGSCSLCSLVCQGIPRTFVPAFQRTGASNPAQNVSQLIAFTTFNPNFPVSSRNKHNVPAQTLKNENQDLFGRKLIRTTRKTPEMEKIRQETSS